MPRPFSGSEENWFSDTKFREKLCFPAKDFDCIEDSFVF